MPSGWQRQVVCSEMGMASGSRVLFTILVNVRSLERSCGGLSRTPSGMGYGVSEGWGGDGFPIDHEAPSSSTDSSSAC